MGFLGFVGYRWLYLCFKRVFYANASNDLTVVQVFGAEKFALGAFGGDNDQRIQKGYPKYYFVL
jgi:hypothetical protein